MHLHQVCGLYKLGGAENTLKCRKLNRVEEEWADRILEVQQGQTQSFATRTDQPQVTIQAGHELVKKPNIFAKRILGGLLDSKLETS